MGSVIHITVFCDIFVVYWDDTGNVCRSSIGVMQMTDGRAEIVTIHVYIYILYIYIVIRIQPVKNNVPLKQITLIQVDT